MLNTIELNKILNLLNLFISYREGQYYICDHNNYVKAVVPKKGNHYEFSFLKEGLPYTIKFNPAELVVISDKDVITINASGVDYTRDTDPERHLSAKLHYDSLIFRERIYDKPNYEADYIEKKSKQTTNIIASTVYDQFGYLSIDEKIEDKDIQKRVTTIRSTSNRMIKVVVNQILTKAGIPASVSNEVEEIFDIDDAILQEFGNYSLPIILINKIGEIIPGIIPYLQNINPNISRIIVKSIDLKR